jgi:hypothetical protein
MRRRLLRSGNSGSLYFAVNGVTLGPAGTGASIVRDVELSADALSANFAMAVAGADPGPAAGGGAGSGRRRNRQNLNSRGALTG